jgi:predicted esterase
VTVVLAHAVPYGEGKLLDIYTPLAHELPSVVLLWHGIGADERDVLAPLASAAAALGVTVLVPDWVSCSPDGGRAQLLASLNFTRELAGPDRRVVLAGWSRGGKSAAALAVNPAVVGGWQPASVVCLAPGFRKPAPTTGSSVPADLARTAAPPVPFWLVHGTKDPVVPPSQSREFAALLAQRGWPVRLDEPPTDHSGVVMAEYDPGLGRSRPATSAPALEAGRLAARLLHAAAAGQRPGG